MQVATPPRHVYLHEVDYVHAKRKVFVVVSLLALELTPITCIEIITYFWVLAKGRSIGHRTAVLFLELFFQARIHRLIT